MMSAMESGEKADLYLKKAKALELHMEPFYKNPNPLPTTANSSPTRAT